MADVIAVGLAMTTTLTDVYEVPASTMAKITLVQVANVDGTNSADATVLWTNASDSNSVKNLIKTVPVAADSSVSALTGTLWLAAGDKIRAQASADSDLEITVSGLAIATS